MTPEYRTEDLTERVEFDDLLKELDVILDAWFLGEVEPALEEAQRARGAAADALDALAG